jgi:hypothetical protein
VPQAKTYRRPAPHSAPSKNLSLLYIWQLCHSFEQHITLSLLRAGSELQLPLLIFPGLSSPLLPSAPRSPQSLITIHRSRRKGAEEGFPCTLVPTSHTSYETPRLLPSWYVLVAVLKTTPQRHTRRSSSVPSQAKLPPSLAPHLPAWAAAAKAETAAAAAAAARRAFGRRLVTSAKSRPSPSCRSCSAPPPRPVEAPTTPASASSASTSRTPHRRETLIKMPRPLLLLPPPLPPRRAAAAAGPPPTAAAAAAASSSATTAAGTSRRRRRSGATRMRTNASGSTPSACRCSPRWPPPQPRRRRLAARTTTTYSATRSTASASQAPRWRHCTPRGQQ